MLKKRQTIRDFLAEILARNGDEAGFADGESLLTSGRLQSIDVVEIVAFLEQAFGVDLRERGFLQEDFDTLEALTRLTEAEERRNAA